MFETERNRGKEGRKQQGVLKGAAWLAQGSCRMPCAVRSWAWEAGEDPSHAQWYKQLVRPLQIKTVGKVGDQAADLGYSLRDMGGRANFSI